VKRPAQDDELQRLRDQLRLRIDAAAKSFAEVLQGGVDLVLAIAHQKTMSEPDMERTETHRATEMLTSREAAVYLGVSAGTLDIWRCRRSYPIPFVKVGRNVRYRKADLDEFLQRRTKGGGDGGDSR
jgi:excisionase family DNA binding protein